jgi:hypothetical protein
MGERLVEPDGQLRRWVNVYVERHEVRTQKGLETPLRSGDKVHIVSSVAGGAPGEVPWDGGANSQGTWMPESLRNWSDNQQKNCTPDQCARVPFVLHSDWSTNVAKVNRG